MKAQPARKHCRYERNRPTDPPSHTSHPMGVHSSGAECKGQPCNRLRQFYTLLFLFPMQSGTSLLPPAIPLPPVVCNFNSTLRYFSSASPVLQFCLQLSLFPLQSRTSILQSGTSVLSPTIPLPSAIPYFNSTVRYFFLQLSLFPLQSVASILHSGISVRQPRTSVLPPLIPLPPAVRYFSSAIRYFSSTVRYFSSTTSVLHVVVPLRPSPVLQRMR